MSVSATLPARPSDAKRRQILGGARQVFGELGFERATVDLIAARAGVSKATLYNHYADKKSLFVDCIAHETEAMSAELSACLGGPAGDVEQVLQLIGEKVMGVFLAPAVVGLYRHIIAEAVRFPDVAQTIFDRGPSAIHRSVAAHLERWDVNGSLRIEDPWAAAVQFVALIQGDLLIRARLGLLAHPVAGDEVRETVRRAVRTFVRAHRP